jgi:hypothetical protein
MMSNHIATSTNIWNYISLTLSIQESYSPMRIQNGNEKFMKNEKEVLLYLKNVFS